MLCERKNVANYHCIVKLKHFTCTQHSITLAPFLTVYNTLLCPLINRLYQIKELYIKLKESSDAASCV